MDKITTDKLFTVQTPQEFESAALAIFNYQFENCATYSEFVQHLNIRPDRVLKSSDIPFLPVEFFKTREIISAGKKPSLVFRSSGTSGISQSRHFVAESSIYEQSFRLGFEQFYGSVRGYAILALLPSYQDREGSSLIYMVDDFIRESESPLSGYFLNNHEELKNTLENLHQTQTRTLLIGVTYALLDFAESHSLEFPELIVMETGGMKGRRREMVREELHETLGAGFGVPTIHSEYGMTELLSQAYSKGAGIFHCPPWMQVGIRDTNDPFEILQTGQTGGINVIDLANVNSCSFIATQDLGKLNEDGSFEVLGRFDNSDIRGCNLLVQ